MSARVQDPSRRVTIGVLPGWQLYWTATSFSYLKPIFEGILAAAQTLGVNVLLGCGIGSWGPEEEAGGIRPVWPVPEPNADFVPIGPWNTDGLIVIPPLHRAERSRYVQNLVRRGFPVVFIGSGEEGPTIAADNWRGIQEALHHLVRVHGYRRIAFLAGSEQDLAGDTGERLAAFRQGLGALGLPIEERLVVFAQHTYEGGYAAMQRLLREEVTFDAVLASNDESAFGAMQALREAGRRVPEDVAVVGFDDRLESAVYRPALTSVHVPLFRMGQQAVTLLASYIRGEIREPVRVAVPTRLQVRESCGCGQSALLADTLAMLPGEATLDTEHLVETMADQLLQIAPGLVAAEALAYSRRLVEAFVTAGREGDAEVFRVAVEGLLAETEAKEDPHIWQAALSLLQAALPGLGLEPEREADLARTLDALRVTVSSAMRLKYRSHVIQVRFRNDRLGYLTARLLSTLDTEQIYRILAQYLPELGIRVAWIALLEGEGSDPVAWSRIRAISEPGQPEVRICSRTFPPLEWLPRDEPYALALLPLVGYPEGRGYMALSAGPLDLLGAIVQHTGAALNAARLYQAAQEGRRLAEEANQMKSRFLSMVSHELRTPLNLIVGTSALVLQESARYRPTLPEFVRRDLERIHASAQHLGRLIDDVLDLASSEAGQLRLAYQHVNLAQVLREIDQLGQQLAQAKGLDWRFALAEEDLWVWGDPTRLRQVTLNLVVNAVKFTSQGYVALSGQVEGDEVVVRVTDTGIGLPPGEQQRIFEEFQRSRRSVKLGYGGIGLGLAICKRLVDLHGGRIGVHSTGRPGEGATFWYALPRIAAPKTLPRALVPRAASDGRVVLLLSPDGASPLVEALQARGFSVQCFPFAATDWWGAALHQIHFNSVIMDVTQGAEQAWETLNLLKRHPTAQDLPVYFLALDETQGDLLSLDYLTKPLDPEDVSRTLEHRLPPEDEDRPRVFLVVDDDPHTLDLHVRIVQSRYPGHQVLTATNGRGALHILQRTPVDLVILDLMMPEVDGFAVLESMRRQPRLRDIPVVVLTGKTLTEAEMQRLNQGVRNIITKGVLTPEETLARLEAALSRRSALSRQARQLVRRAVAFIQQHYASDLTRQDIARHVGLSEDYLSACFREELGLTPIAYLNRYRIKRAKELLRQTDWPIAEIARQVGFTSLSYFSRLFRRETGMAPSEYRRRAAEGG